MYLNTSKTFFCMTLTYEKHPFLQSRGIPVSCDNPHVDSIFAPVLFFLSSLGLCCSSSRYEQQPAGLSPVIYGSVCTGSETGISLIADKNSSV